MIDTLALLAIPAVGASCWALVRLVIEAELAPLARRAATRDADAAAEYEAFRAAREGVTT